MTIHCVRHECGLERGAVEEGGEEVEGGGGLRLGNHVAGSLHSHKGEVVLGVDSRVTSYLTLNGPWVPMVEGVVAHSSSPLLVIGVWDAAVGITVVDEHAVVLGNDQARSKRKSNTYGDERGVDGGGEVLVSRGVLDDVAAH